MQLLHLLSFASMLLYVSAGLESCTFPLTGAGACALDASASSLFYLLNKQSQSTVVLNVQLGDVYYPQIEYDLDTLQLDDTSVVGVFTVQSPEASSASRSSAAFALVMLMVTLSLGVSSRNKSYSLILLVALALPLVQMQEGPVRLTLTLPLNSPGFVIGTQQAASVQIILDTAMSTVDVTNFQTALGLEACSACSAVALECDVGSRLGLSADQVGCVACTPVDGCGATLTCTDASDSQCSTCARGRYLIDGTSDTCASCTSVVGCYTSVACTNPSNSVCPACSTGYWLKNGQCNTCTKCATGSYALTACAKNADTGCRACAVCPAGRYITTACGVKTNTVCSYCTQITNCVSVTCTTSLDEVCNVCQAGYIAQGSKCVIAAAVP